jgi:hypothetical protein
VTDVGVSNIDQVALARGVDRVLNVAWRIDDGDNEDIRAARVTPDGRTVGGVTVAVDDWSQLNTPTLLVEAGGGLRVIFAGLRGTQDDFSSGRAASATAPPDGSSWTFSEALHTDGVSVNEYAGAFGGAVKLDGTPVFSWGATVKIGLEPSAELDLAEGCCTYDSDVAVDPVTGEVVVVWYSNVADQHGTLARVVDPSLGPIVYVPGSARADRKAATDNNQRVGLTSRLGAPGIFVGYATGYPTTKTINVWRLGSDRPIVVSRRGGTRVALAPGPGGRIWIAWEGTDGRIHASRSNPQATVFGAIVTVPLPRGTDNLWKLAVEGSLGLLDVVANLDRDGIAGWHTQIRPGLTLRATGGATFLVTDAGVPVPGAEISVAGRRLRTNAAGRATVDLPPGTFTARATKPGYTPATLRVRGT